MFYIYPANRMEDLLSLFLKIRQLKPLPILAKETVMVQSQGLQHWLNMEVAKANRISMNSDFVLPAQYLWTLLKTLCKEQFPEQLPYSREVLSWRIDALLQQSEVIADEACLEATDYWYNSGNQQDLRRYQLACQLADLYEQYLIYRPEWLAKWRKGKHVASDDQVFNQAQRWQCAIWFYLQQDIPYDPSQLMTIATNNIEHLSHLLPQRISLFGINALAPMWLEFLELLADYTDVHVFHLNPCFEFWSDVQTDKARAKQAYLQQLGKWPEDIIDGHAVNPLLANLGQQGREFLSLLHGVENIEIPLYDQLFESTPDKATQASVLMHLQRDILTLHDARESPQARFDDSVVITSAHSALREVQGLHDYLLHLFNNDPDITPKDVIVMCPQVEAYAAYIDSVFVRGWDDIGEGVPPLPCSIADRVSKESEPLVHAFSELLSMPDSRFSVASILSLLELNSVRQRFGLSVNDVERVREWLIHANVYWGLDAEHKKTLLQSDRQTSQFTWQQGLSKLLQGFAYGDRDTLLRGGVVLADVEGNDALILGKLILFLEQLQHMQRVMQTQKTPEQWYQFLTLQVQRLFADSDDDNGLNIIHHALEQLQHYVDEAKYEHVVDWSVVSDFLNHHFSQPDPGRQFMIGQITFCSMMPMRSIPFKVVAILGLNDGEYPRQRIPVGFDLMQLSDAKIGDRSRRGDDKYLFLEALISARQHLYLSYQGRDSKNNNERQPSIVLRELMEYLQSGYQWSFEQGDNDGLRQLPLQAFAKQNYSISNRFASFDQNWLALTQKSEPISAEMSSGDSTSGTVLVSNAELSLSQHSTSTDVTLPVTVDLDQVIEFFKHPTRYFAQRQLKLYFEQTNTLIDDVEPFQTNALTSYLFKGDALALALTTNKTPAFVEQQQFAALSGEFPDVPSLAETLQQWQDQMLGFANTLTSHLKVVTNNDQLSIDHFDNEQRHQVTLTTEQGEICVQGSVATLRSEDKIFCVDYRHASTKGNDLMKLYLQHLLVQVSHTDHRVTSYGYYFHQAKQGKEDSVAIVRLEPVEDAKQQLLQFVKTFLLGQQQALLVDASMAFDLMWKRQAFNPKPPEQPRFEKYWQGSDFGQVASIGEDPYRRYFFQQCPDIEALWAELLTLYAPMFSGITMQLIGVAQQSRD
ncbi:exodeoxyribonuclease V subunit gamma [Thalassotalea ponticola]|uniref:exodeoxyribonuclease V subunit gamma n=1 Tax=Thalassotalea ponticola TaxID=1523392 RepID=UPI0025B35F6D|nr:exodeoxyribonuclease V subunit gamma [Thalassotalea ponticola]MDN3653116.1 exodeoxyribonuclease V subunit gamma [Thalassotalea ponticola]